jgi:DNA-binding transcriptional ArsR family regulator
MAEPVSANLLRALAHPARLAMLVTLEQGELTVAELAARVEVPEPEGAAHLEALRGAGLVVAGERAGTVRASTHGWAEIAARLGRLERGEPGG